MVHTRTAARRRDATSPAPRRSAAPSQPTPSTPAPAAAAAAAAPPTKAADSYGKDGSPPSFLCPIGLSLMRDPVVCVDGHSYERANIVRWLRESATSPATGAPLVTDVVVSNHALRKSIEEHAQQCFSRVSAGEIISVALLNPLLEPLRMCLASGILRRPRVLVRLLRRVGRISIFSRLGRFGCAALLGALFSALMARAVGPFALLCAVAAGVAFQAGVMCSLLGCTVCAYLVLTRFVSRERVRRFLAPQHVEAAALLSCVVAYTHILGYALFRPEPCEAEGQACDAAATSTLISFWCWAVQLNVSLLKVEDDPQRLRCLDIPNFALLWLWCWRFFSETQQWLRAAADDAAARPVMLRGEALAFGFSCAALQCIYLITPQRKIRRH